ncbi:MAG: hypothetical protein HY712_05460 [candidate division NC10 bacterium]|nr:hypothetical protein [candidate division NC10 bacterium]
MRNRQEMVSKPERQAIVLSRACAGLYEEVASVCKGWDDIDVLVDRREGTGKHGFIVPRVEEPKPAWDLPDTA